jgi:hypothetical protein
LLPLVWGQLSGQGGEFGEGRRFSHGNVRSEWERGQAVL